MTHWRWSYAARSNSVFRIERYQKNEKGITGVTRAVLNTFGSYGLYHHGYVNYAPSVAGGMNSSKELDERRYNKTFLIPVPSEEESFAIMQQLAEITNIQEGTGNGILFTVPMVKTD